MAAEARRILVIDDDAVMRTTLREALAAGDPPISVEEADGGLAGLERALAEPFDAVVLDHRLGDTTGLFVLQRLNDEGFQTPIVFITGFGDVDLAVAAMKLGAADFVSKDERGLDRIVRSVRDAASGRPGPEADGDGDGASPAGDPGSSPSATGAEAVTPRPGDLINGRYRVESVLNQGASGVAITATDKRLERRVLVKMLRIRRSMREEAVRSFLHEARLIARMEHPNVVRVYDFGYWRETPFLVMEHAEARSLRDVLEEADKIPPEKAVPIMRDVLAGLAYLHAHAILHRDLKPANVLYGRDGHWKLGDFGIAIHMGKFAHGDLMAPPRTSLGTPAFMSPEAARGDALTAATDVFSAGAMMHLLLTGRPYLPLDGLSLADMRRQIQRAQWPALDVTGWPAIGPLVGRMMAKDPAKRPKDGAAALAELERLAGRRETA